MRACFLTLLLSAAMLRFAGAAPIQPEVAEVNFGPGLTEPAALKEAKLPAWLTAVEQQGGSFTDDPKCWLVPAAAAKGVGRITLTLDRTRIAENLVATILFDAPQTSDIAVQLFDGAGRVVALDLFGNLTDVGREAMTDTFVIPLKKYPTAEKIVIRRISGEVKVFGVVLFPVVTEGVPVPGALEELARVLGDPLSPENPMVKSLRSLARSSGVAIHTVLTAPTAPVADPLATGTYAAAVAPAASVKVAAPSDEGLVAHWSFDKGDGTDLSPRKNHATAQGSVTYAPGSHGRAVKMNRFKNESLIVRSTPDFDLKDTITVAAWIKYSSLAPRWGSQIMWFGDRRLGLDPWTFKIHPEGTLEFRSDRSITGEALFTVYDDEILLAPKGGELVNQHVAVQSPKPLAPNTWYFVAATIEKVSPRVRVFHLYVNGEPVGETRTAETVHYDTDKMWLVLGGVDTGGWQNFDGLLDDARIYSRTLSAAEIRALYQQPWQ